MKLLTLTEILEILNIKRATFYVLRKKGSFPKPILLTSSKRSIRWLEEDIENFIKSKTINL